LVDLETLLDRCRAGDGLAWEALVRRYQSRVYGVALHFVRDRDLARDLAQEIFVRLYERLPGYNGETFVAWMYRLARNLCIDHLRRRGARPPFDDQPIGETIDPLDTDADPERDRLRHARSALLYRAIDRLGEAHREMILLKEIQGLELHEIADLLGAPLGTVKSRSHRARAELARVVLELDPGYAAGSG
jgi:RNA polymerase sigma-70 factor (ECF subfamily)